MYTATIKNVASAKNGAPSIYCQSKSGNIYKLKQQVPLQQHARLIAQIRSAKVINTQHWIKIKEGELKAKPAKAENQAPIDNATNRAIAAKKGWETRRSNAEDIAHATKMFEFEQSGDEAGAIAYLDARIAQQVAS